MKHLLTLSLSLLLTWTASAQHSLSFGLNGGYGYTAMVNKATYDEYEKPASFAGSAGIHAAYRFSKLISIRAELNSSTIHQKFTYEDNDFGPYKLAAADRVRYLDVPVVVRGQYSLFYAELGAQISFLQSALNDHVVEIGFQRSYKDQDVSASFKKSYWSGVAGLGAQFALTKNKRLYADAGIRLCYGLTDMVRTLDWAAVERLELTDQLSTISKTTWGDDVRVHAMSCRFLMSLSYKLALKQTKGAHQ